MKKNYVHGYDERESDRLQDQASTLVELLHAETSFMAGSKVLEVGCGVGVQTTTLARNSPDALIIAIDISGESIKEAQQKVEAAGLTNVDFQQADIFKLPKELGMFNHIFVCFVLEHLAKPAKALRILRDHLEPNGTMTVIEGDHGSAFFYPDSEAAQEAIRCQAKLQDQAGGNAMIGRELRLLLHEAGYTSIHISPRIVYVDSSKPTLVEGFIKKTFTAMIEGIRESALCADLIEPSIFDKGIKDLYRTTEPDGVFCYTFFKGVARP